MEKYAIILLGGKQIKITEGNEFFIERQAKFDYKVLAYFDGKETHIGQPYLADVKVEAKLEDGGRGKKIRVARFKSKSRYRKVKGHRQPLSKIKINSVGKNVSSKKPTTAKKSNKTVAKKPAKVPTTKEEKVVKEKK
jgi:large subunit ribosomal protein L21